MISDTLAGANGVIPPEGASPAIPFSAGPYSPFEFCLDMKQEDVAIDFLSHVVADFVQVKA